VIDMSMFQWFEWIGIALLGWLALGYQRRREFPLPAIPAAPVPPPPDPPLVSIIVPARNEAVSIEACLRSLLAQDYPRFELIVIDDCSDDGTGAIIDRLAQAEPRLRAVRGEPLPPGWMGKVHAIDQG
jgi:cellulose synthase/poly-beta-1,6-N-acetylglucosamine synthase-like glycosyltransferase